MQTEKVIEIVKKTNFTIKELLEMPNIEIPFLWGQIIPKSAITFITGASDCNKSTFLRELLFKIGAGSSEFLDLPLTLEHNRCIYVSTEDACGITSTLIKKRFSDTEYNKEWQENTLFVFETDNLIRRLENILKRNPCDVIVIDTWTDTYLGDMNQTNKVRANLEQFSTLAKKYECAFIMVHHQKKGSEDRETHKGDMLGSQGIEAKARCVIEIKREVDNIRTLRILKGNYTPDNIKSTKKYFQVNEDMSLTFIRDENKFAFRMDEKLFKEARREEQKKKLFELREQGISFAKIHVILFELFPNDMVSETTLKNWMSTKPDGQTGKVLE